jgi:hypothetical protein
VVAKHRAAHTPHGPKTPLLQFNSIHKITLEPSLTGLAGALDGQKLIFGLGGGNGRFLRTGGSGSTPTAPAAGTEVAAHVEGVGGGMLHGEVGEK